MSTTTPPLIPPPPLPGGGPTGDQQRMIWMLDTIRLLLDETVHVQPSPFPPQLQPLFINTWTEAERSIKDATDALRNPAEFATLYPSLQKAGLSGPMLQLKAESLYHHGGRYLGQFITYPAKPTWGERIAKFFRPAFKCANSVMASLKGVLPIRRVSTTLRQVLTKFSEFFVCWVFYEEIPRQDRVGTTIANWDDPQHSRFCLLKGIALFESGSWRFHLPSHS